jgi:hypothetical protein
MNSERSDRDKQPRWDDGTFRVSVIKLNAEDSLAFADALLNPREPPERLRAAVGRYRELIGG